MLEISEILQALLVTLVMLLITLSIFSRKIFQGNNKKYFLFISCGVLFLSFISLEAVFQIYLLKFYLYFGWSAIILFLLLFLMIVSPFIGSINRILTDIIHLKPAVTFKVTQSSDFIKQFDLKIPKREIPVQKELIPSQDIIETLQPSEEPINTSEEVILLPEVTLTKEEQAPKQIKKKTVRKTPMKNKTTKESVKTKGKGNAKH